MLSFYRWSLLSPVVVPLIAAGVMWLDGGFRDGGGVTYWASAVVLPGLFGFAPYTVTIAIGWPWIRRFDEARLRRFLWILPVLVLPATVLFGVAWGLSVGPGGAAFAAVWFPAFALGTGYAYVVMVSSIGALVKRFRVFMPK